MLIVYLKLFTTQATQQLFEKTTKCCLFKEKNSGFLVLELEVKRNEEDLGKSHKKDTRE